MEGISDWVRWAVGGIAGGIILVWGHITGRIKALEASSITHMMLKDHITNEEKTFDVLFQNQRETTKAISEISKSVARIEGKLSSNKDWQDHK